MGFPWQEYWSGLSFPSPGDLPHPGIELTSPALAGRFFTTEPLGKQCLQKHPQISEGPPPTPGPMLSARVHEAEVEGFRQQEPLGREPLSPRDKSRDRWMQMATSAIKTTEPRRGIWHEGWGTSLNQGIRDGQISEKDRNRASRDNSICKGPEAL